MNEETKTIIETKQSELRCLRSQLSESSSPIGDWKNIKQLDTGQYTEAEMAEYRQARAEVRARINTIEAEIEELEGTL